MKDEAYPRTKAASNFLNAKHHYPDTVRIMMQIIQTYPVGQCSGGPYLKRDAYNLPYSILTPKCPTF